MVARRPVAMQWPVFGARLRMPIVVVATALSAASCEARAPGPVPVRAVTLSSEAIVPSAPDPPTASSSVPVPKPITPTGTVQLAVGEAVVIAGDMVSSAGTGEPEALDLMGFRGHRLVVSAVRPGTQDLAYTDAEDTRREAKFEVVASRCRDKPLNPALILDIDGHAVVETGEVTMTETAIRYPWVANAHKSDIPGQLIVRGQSRGRSTVIAVKKNGDVLLLEVFVGGVCAERAYLSAAPAVPPGLLGPKGDGTCVRRRDGSLDGTAAPCPDPTELARLSDQRLSPIACEWAASCQRSGDEGCCIGCRSPMPANTQRRGTHYPGSMVAGDWHDADRGARQGCVCSQKNRLRNRETRLSTGMRR